MTKNRVERLLSSSEELRNSDKRLLVRFWEDEGFVLSESQKRIFLEKCTPAESITRARRGLRQEDFEKFAGTDEVEEQRYTKYLDHRFNTDYENPYR